MAEVTIGTVTQSTFTWEIPNFTTIKADEGKAVLSPTFCTTHHCDKSPNKILNLHWRIRFYPKGGYMGNCKKDFISVCLENLDEFEVSTEFSIALVDKSSNGVVHERCSIEKQFEKKKFWGWSDFVKKEMILNGQSILVNDVLTISCGIYSTKVTLTDCDKGEGVFSEKLLDHLKMLFDTGKFSDVKIRIGNEELHVHKNIVMSSSSVFLEIYEKQLKEQNEDVIEIDDIKFDVIKEMFRYMYTRKVNDIEKIVNDLFVAADKYRMEGLKKLCEKSLSESLDEKNALERLELAIRYNLKNLKQSAIQFVVGKKIKDLK